jgi:hypothetical protein
MRIASATKLWGFLGLSGKPVSLGQGLFGKVMRVTPTQAAMWLENYNNQNRKMKVRSAEKYAGDMNAGRWRLTHEGIAFNDDPDNPNLADGQNRLKAIMDSNKPQHVIVVVGLNEDALEVINEGVKRNANDAANILGLDYGKKYLAIVRNLRRGFHELTVPLSNSHTIELAKEHKNTVKWVLENLPERSGISTNALLLGALARAYLWITKYGKYTKSEREEMLSDLKVFMQVLSDGQYKNLPKQFQNGATLRDYLLKKNWGKQREVWGACENMIKDTLAGKLRCRVSTNVKRELFVMPWDGPQPVKVRRKKGRTIAKKKKVAA